MALVKIFTQSAADLLDEWFESPEIKVTLATDGVIGANGGPRSPGTAYILMHHCMGGVAGQSRTVGLRARRHGRGLGSHRRLGAQPRRGDSHERAGREACWCATAARAAWCCENGEEIEARYRGLQSRSESRLSCSCSSRADLDAEFRASIGHFRIEGTSLKINLALEGLPEFTALPGAPGPQHRATMHICPSIDYVERAWDDAKYGRPSHNPLLEMTCPTMYDPSLAPAGKHIMGIFLQYAPYTLRDATWDELREPFGDRVLEVIEEYAPNIREIVRDARC